MEQDFLQSIKLEISRNFTLTAYERIAFHKILNILKTAAGTQILIRDLGKPGPIRRSALSTLKKFSNPEVKEVFLDIFSNCTDLQELDILFEYFELSGDNECIDAIKNFVEKNKLDNTFAAEVRRAIFLVGLLDREAEREIPWLKQIAMDANAANRYRAIAVETMHNMRDLEFYEKLLDENNDELSYAIFEALSSVAMNEMAKYLPENDNDLFTHTPDVQDAFLLNLRVLLSKASSGFESFSPETRCSFLKALILCNHREYLVFVMKALTSEDTNLIDMTLYLILSIIRDIQNPDKLFRNLISLPSLTERDDKIIVEIFIRYFQNLRDNKNTSIIRNKIYNYLIVMLDNFFENYRKQFIIPEIKEKDYTDEYQKIRSYILNKLNSYLKHRVLKCLTTEDLQLKTLLIEIGEKVSYVPEDEKDVLYHFVEVLSEKDQKARDIAASRISDIDFEKKFLKRRIIRLCSIISQLNIEDASTSLVKMFNYIKKYYDADLYMAVSIALARLNYPYMLGELELMINGEGEIITRSQIITLLSQFREPRSATILLDFLRDHFDTIDEATVLEIFNVLNTKNLKIDKSANEICKMIIDKHESLDVKAAAVHQVGLIGFEKDMLYLHELFMESGESLVKEACIRAMDIIVRQNPAMGKKEIIRYFKSYLNDPAIKVRIFSCIILMQLGDLSALGLLRDMMIIKNKDIQREILLILGAHMTLELAFFLISILSEEYAISQDIIPLFNYLAPDEKQEVDHYIVSLFKKYEGTRFDYNSRYEHEQNEEFVRQIQGFKRLNNTVMRIHIFDMNNILTQYQSSLLTIRFRRIIGRIFDIFKTHEGVIGQLTGGTMTVFFTTIDHAASASISILDELRKYNAPMVDEEKVGIFIYVDEDEVVAANGEHLFLHNYDYDLLIHSDIRNRAFFSKGSADNINESFNCKVYPLTAFLPNGHENSFKELINEFNFTETVEEVLKKIDEQRDLIAKRERELDKANVKQTLEGKNREILVKALDGVGKDLKKDLNEIVKYVKRRSTDRELIARVEKMTSDVYKRYNVDITKIEIE